MLKDKYMAFDWGTGISNSVQGGIIPGAFSGWMSGRSNKKIDDLLKQIPGELRKYLEPYINAGQGALGNLQGVSGEYEKLYQDPNAIISRLGGGYQQSPGYQWRLNQGENAINNAAAAGGMAGTAQHQQQAGELATNLASQDYNDYLKQVLGLFTGGLEGRTGIEQGIFNQGATSAGDLATSLANLLKQRAGLEYERNASRNKGFSDMFSSVGSLFG
jgi:hypothetical protein